MNVPTYATAVNCIDGRVQIPVIKYLRAQYGVDYVDMVTEPGAVAVIAEHRDIVAVESIKRRVDVSKMRHASKVLAITTIASPTRSASRTRSSSSRSRSPSR
jgi:hypothetical protein